jgi:hydroxyacylglutathione hydrolase
MTQPSAPPIEIEPIACLEDNYAYLIRATGSADAYLVDPSQAPPVAAVLDRHRLTLRGILATHHHPDHVGGVAELRARAGAGESVWVAGHALDRGRIPEQTVFVDCATGRFVPSGLEIFGRPLLAMHIPGHTRAAIAWGLAATGDAPGAAPTDVFTGDTLFGAGCGRLFEGTPAQMFESLRALTTIPETSRLWFGHEYTAGNLRFAATVDPDNAAVAERRAHIAPPTSTTPTTVALERATNPFVRAASIDALATLRAAKDRF